MVNYIYVASALLLAIIVIFSRKLFFALIFAAVQFAMHKLASKLKLDVIPFVNFDYELSNIIAIISVYMFGLQYAFIIIGVTVVIHIFHQEIADILGLSDYVIKTGFLAVIISLFPEVSLAFLIPNAILAQKALGVAYNKVLGSDIFSVFNFKEAFTVMVYFAVFRLLG